MDENAKQMDNELLNMRGEAGAGREPPSGTSRLASRRSGTVRSKKRLFWASKTPAAAVSLVIKMPLRLPSPSDFNYKYL